MRDRRVPYDEPVRAGVLCQWCGEEIEAMARLIGSLEIKGLHGYEWRHVVGKSVNCTRTYTARPYSDWEATKRVEAAIEAERAARDALIAATETEEDDTP